VITVVGERVRWVTVVTTSVLCGVVLAGCGSGSAETQSRATPTLTPTLTPTPTRTSTPTSTYQRCTSDQLRGRAGRSGAAAGTRFQNIRLTNDSSHPCTLSGVPAQVVGFRSNGKRADLTVTISAAVSALAGPGPANLTPGSAGWFTLSYPDGCDAAVNGEQDDIGSVQIGLRSGGRIRVGFPRPLNVICGVVSSGFGATADVRSTTSP
jgi:hypothetical protein